MILDLQILIGLLMNINVSDFLPQNHVQRWQIIAILNKEQNDKLIGSCENG